MKILTSREMKEVDRTAIEEIGIPGVGAHGERGIARRPGAQVALYETRGRGDRHRGGKGNNGGDGFVVARHLFNSGGRPEVLLLAAKEEVKGDAAVNLAVALKLGIPVREVLAAADWKKARVTVFHASVLVDALFGTGLLKPLDGLFALAVEDINRSAAFKLSVDIPSGLSADTFETIGPSVKADLTVTLAAPKIAHIFPPAADRVGELVVAPIGIPPFLLDKPELGLELVEEKTVRPFFGKRKKDTHKGSYGHLLIIAGSLGKTGAAVLAGRAALRSGAGLVTVATAQSALPIVARSMAELMTEPLAETRKSPSPERPCPGRRARQGKERPAPRAGLVHAPSTSSFVLGLLPQVKVPLVIDADGLNIIAAKPGVLGRLRAPAVLTPHPGEFARLVGRTTGEVLRHRLEITPEFAKRYGVIVVLKGHRTLIAGPDGRVFVNPTGNPGMATGGTGDVLGGTIGAQVVQEKDLVGAVLSAVYVHGLAGDIAAERLGEKSLTAGDIIRYLPPAMKALAGE